MAKIKSFKPKLSLLSRLSAPVADVPASVTYVENADQVNTPQPRVTTLPGKFGVLKLIPLGGMGDVTKNMYVYEYGDDIMIIDCGIGFPDEGMLGIDLVIPDITYLKDKKAKIKGIVISHAHEDHIGSLPYLWPSLECPIYAQPLAAGFIKSKFAEHNLPKDVIQTLDINSKLDLGAFHVEFYRACHSVPDATGIVINTPHGKIIHQSDFKLDWTPVNGEMTDVGRVAIEGRDGVLLMLVDALGADRHGYTSSELEIEDTFANIERKTEGKLIITTNSSSITRIQQILNVAQQCGRKVALSGRSMDNNFQVARDLGYLNVPNGVVIAQDEIKRTPDNKLIVIMAGSQGQPGSSLSRAANNEHKFVTLKKTDNVVFSATPIPASELAYFALIEKLIKMGHEVFYPDNTPNLHVSGHESAEEIKLMIRLANPQYVLPIGATIRGMKAFSEMAQHMGYQADHVLLPEGGGVVEITPNKVEINGRVEAKNVYVDGLGVGDIGNIVLRDRQVMAEEGIVMVVVPMDSQSGKLVGDVDIVSRGFVFEKEAGGLLEDAKRIVRSVLDDHQDTIVDWRFMRRHIEENLEKYLYEATQRRPMILPVVVEV